MRLPLRLIVLTAMEVLESKYGLTNVCRRGLSLLLEVVFLGQSGLTPLEALQTATLNPAQFFDATDSLGTVAPGKLADLVLLDANPLADIRNVMTTRAVVANGRYFNRTALDTLDAQGLQLARSSRDEIMTHGRVRTGALGIAGLAEVFDSNSRRAVGLQIVQFQSDSPAEAAGLAVGDILVSMDGTPVAPMKRFVSYAAQWKPGQRSESTS